MSCCDDCQKASDSPNSVTVSAGQTMGGSGGMGGSGVAGSDAAGAEQL